METIDFELPKGTKSLNLYKLHPPFRRLVDGHGYPGVLLERKTDGKIQCHVCGKWFVFLGKHASAAHKITANEYKKKFSLLKKDGLVSRELNEKLVARAIMGRAISSKRMTKANANKPVHVRKGWRATLGAASRQSQNSLSYLNARGLCPDQINHRFDVVAAMLKRQPIAADLMQYDNSVRWEILKRYGSFNKYIEHRGLQANPTTKALADVDILAAIRNVYLKKGRVKAQDFISRPSYETIRRRFGGLENALREAGIDPATWVMVG